MMSAKAALPDWNPQRSSETVGGKGEVASRDFLRTSDGMSGGDRLRADQKRLAASRRPPSVCKRSAS